MNLEVTDHHPKPMIKLMNSNIVGLDIQTDKYIKLLMAQFKDQYDDVNIEHFIHKDTIARVKKRYAKLTKFYYPNSLYVTVTVRSSEHTVARLNLNKDNLHTLDIYVSDQSILNRLNELCSVTETLHGLVKRYKYLL